jgi:hypothetical protein
MALLNRALTKTEVQGILTVPAPTHSLWAGFLTHLSEPYAYCNYSATRAEAHFTDPKAFYVWPRNDSPSDCVWMVPGLEQRPY